MNVSEEDFNRLQEDNQFLRDSIAELRDLLKKATDSIAQHTGTASKLRLEIHRMETYCMKCEHSQGELPDGTDYN